MNINGLTKTQSLRVRHSLGARNLIGANVIIIPGIALAPQRSGSGSYHTNRSGDLVRHPSAYAKVGWSSLVYHSSSDTITVGRDWLKNSTKRYANSLTSR